MRAAAAAAATDACGGGDTNACGSGGGMNACGGSFDAVVLCCEMVTRVAHHQQAYKQSPRHTTLA